MTRAASPTSIPLSLRALPQWLVWRYEERGGKATKVPYRATSDTAVRASSTDRATWASYETALDCWQRNAWVDGIGIAITRDTGIVGVDLDHCIGEYNAIEPWALAIISQLDSYTEISPSGRGVRIFARGTLPVDGRNSRTGIEMYCAGRYLTVTGNHVAGTPDEVEDRQDALLTLFAEAFPQREPPRGANGHKPEPLDLDDQSVLDRMFASKNGPAVVRLWAGDTALYHDDDSSADLALCNHLAFWTGGDIAQMDRLFRQSGLFRPKWDERHHGNGDTYGQGTIKVALAGRGPDDFYRPGQRSEAPSPRDRGEGDEAAGEAAPPEDGTPEVPAGDGPAPGTALTDLGNAERFIAQHGEDVRYIARWKEWLVWNGQRWVNNDRRLVQQLAMQTVRAIYAEAAEIEDEKRRKAVVDHARRSESEPRLKAMLALAESLPGVSLAPEELDTDPWLLNCRNGTVDLRTGDLLPHRREDHLTKMCPVEYDTAAIAPVWTKFLDRVLDGKEDLIAFVQRAAGYSLTGHTGEECLFLCHGTGRNGKTKFLGALEHVLGDYAKPTKPDVFMEKRQGGPTNDLADLAGARFVPSIETGEGSRLAEALLKWLTGGDTIKARFLYKENFSFRPQLKLWLATNHKPTIRGSDEGIWSRIHLVPFTVTIPAAERDKTLSAKLEAEAAGILAWAIEGCVQWQIHGLGDSEAVRNATQEYREEMDVLADFLSDCCLLRDDIRSRAKALYERYEQWARANGMTPSSSTWFGRKLGERGFKRLKSDGLIWWHGVGVLASE